MENNSRFFQKFHSGCNYWASKTGVFMWSRWDAASVEDDLRVLSSNGLKTLRVFPLWSDFQPIKIHYGFAGSVKEIRIGEKRRDDSAQGVACIDGVMVSRFEHFCQLALKYDIELTVMLLTGWMSGRQFKPEPLQERNVYTDPFSLKWQVRYVDYFVNHFKKFDCIIGWGLGNESNAMDACPSCEAAYSWTALISKTIRSADPSRPIISGMHSLTVDGGARGWRIEDQGELVDVMTTHPYSAWVKYCNTEPLLSLKSTLHPVAECDFYSDLTHKPAMIEEIGDLGRAFTNEERGRLYCQTLLLSAWANGSLGMLWWCGFDSQNIDDTPYQWFEFECDLGLFDTDKKPKPVLGAYEDFDEILSELPAEYRKIGGRQKDALCILSEGQDNWAAALGTYVLCKQAGFDVEFAAGSAKLPQKDIYMLPCLCGPGALNQSVWKELVRRVYEDGATLYLSLFDGWLSNLNKFAGVNIGSRSIWEGGGRINFKGDGEFLDLPADGSFSVFHREGGTNVMRPVKLLLQECGCEVLAVDDDSNSVFTMNNYGKGRVFLLNYGLEMILAKNAGALEATSPDYAAIYRRFADIIYDKQVFVKETKDRALCLTTHRIDTNKVVCVGINHVFEDCKAELKLNDNYVINRVLHGRVDQRGNIVDIFVKAGDCFVVEMVELS